MKFFLSLVISIVYCCGSLFGQNIPLSLITFDFSALTYRFSMDAIGNVIVVWNTNNGTRTVLQAAYKPVAGPWQLPGDPRFQNNVISPINLDVLSYVFAGDLAGNAVVVWKVNITTFLGTKNTLQASFKPAGKPWEPPITISPPGFQVLSEPAVAINAGNVVVSWRISNNTNAVVQGAYKAAGKAWEIPGSPIFEESILSPIRFDVQFPPQVSVDSLGNAISAWEIYGTTNVAQAVLKTPTTPWEFAGDPRFQTNIQSRIGFDLYTPPKVSIEAGNAVLIWQAYSRVDNNLLLQTSYRPKGKPWEIPGLN